MLFNSLEFIIAGCFLLVVTLKNYEREDETGQYTQGKLLFEGTSNLLRKIIETEHCDLIVKFASLGTFFY